MRHKPYLVIMNARINQLVKSLLHKDSLEQCSLYELQQFAERHPYFGAAQLLLTKKLQAERSDQYDQQLQKTYLFFHNPLWVEHLLNDTGAATIKSTPKKEEPVPAAILVETAAPAPEINEPIPAIMETIAIPGVIEPREEKTQDTLLEIPTPVTEMNELVTPSEETAAVQEIIETTKVYTNDTQEDITLQIAGVNEPEPASVNIDATQAIIDPIKLQTEQAPMENPAPAAEINIHAPETMENLVNPALIDTVEDTLVEMPAFKMQQPGPDDSLTNELLFEPFHTVDYFASQGIKFKEEERPKDKFGIQLKSFTDWLKTMKRLPQIEINKNAGTTADHKVEQLAENSLQEREIVTEAMAEVWEKQGNSAKAIDIYSKLSLLEPAKSPYFAAKIEDLKKLN
jgi:hypothetical protein